MWYNNFMDYKNDKEYLSIVNELIESDKIQELKHYTQHHYGSRLEHVISVSYMSYRIAKRLHLDARSVARAGILHDYYYYDWHEYGMTMSEHAYEHPIVALRNAKKLTSVNALEEEIILTHMYPSGGGPRPKHAEAWLLDTVDDYMASREGASATITGFVMQWRFREKAVFDKVNKMM